MGRIARLVVPGEPHHVTQRGNDRGTIFYADSDYLAYLQLLRHYAHNHSLRIWAWCLMPNHIHLVVVPAEGSSLTATLRAAHGRYTDHYRSCYGGVGHLWQGRFYSYPLDEEHLWAAVRYVERNPVRANLVAHASVYKWSSARSHCGLRQSSLLDPVFPPEGVIENWTEWLTTPEDADDLQRLRKHTISGRPCGNRGFQDRVREKTGQTPFAPRG